MSPNGAGAPATAIGNPCKGVKKTTINQELWQACAGPLVSLPSAGTHVVYFPQGHSEQVAASLKKDVDAQIPNYPNLPSKLLCRLHSVTLHADPETDEVYAQMTLQPVPSFDKDALLRSDLSLKSNKPQTEFFCKTLTASDTSTHGGFSVPRRAAEKIFPPLDFKMQPPAQELVARDLHDTLWTFRHIYRGQPKRHLLTTGWSLFVSGKRLFTGDSVLFIRDEKQQLLLGIRRANRQPTNLSSSVLSSDSMHIGILAAAAHAAANNSPFTIYNNSRASPSEFVIPLAKYYKAVNSYQISLGMRFRMMFETEESGTRRYMGTITGISDLDASRWKNSQWRNLQVGWDESTAGERRNRVSVWEIEPVIAPFFICPPPFIRSKRSRQPGMPDDDSSDIENLFKRAMPWMSDDMFMKDSQAIPGLSLMQWMNVQPNPSLANSIQPNYLPSLLPGPVLQNYPPQLGFSSQQHIPQKNNIQFEAQRPPQQVQQIGQLAKVPLPSTLNPLGSTTQLQQQLGDISQQTRQNHSSQVQVQVQNQNIISQPPLIQNHQLNKNLPQPQQVQQQQQQHQLQHQIIGKSVQHHQIMGQSQPQTLITSHPSDQINQQQIQTPEHQIQLQMLQKKLQEKQQQQQQLLLSHQSTFQQQSCQVNPLQDQQRQQLLDMSQSFCRPVIPSQMLDVPQATTTSLSQTQMMSNGNNQTYIRLSTPPQQQKQPGLVPDFPSLNNNQLAETGGNILTGSGWGHSVITEDIPYCSTSPSTNNGQNTVPQNMNHMVHQNTGVGKEMGSSTTAALLHANNFGIMPSNTNYVKDLQQKSEVKPSVNISKCQNEGFFVAPQTYLNIAATQTDYLDTSSSATSVCLSQNDMQYQQQTNNIIPFNPQSMLFRDTSQNEEILADSRISISFGTTMEDNVPLSPKHLLTKSLVGLEKDFSNSIPSEDLPTYENSKIPLQEISSSVVSQSFGVPDMTFNSIDSTIDDNIFWAPQPPQQFQRMRTYTKVYKRGAVGRSIDISRYMGYDDLRQDLARRFGIEGQLEDRHRVGWKLVYVDHENDVLLVGDDPWEEFVSFVNCIKILSPQEVQLMRLDVDFGSSVLNNQACSSSDNGNG